MVYEGGAISTILKNRMSTFQIGYGFYQEMGEVSLIGRVPLTKKEYGLPYKGDGYYIDNALKSMTRDLLSTHQVNV